MATRGTEVRLTEEEIEKKAASQAERERKVKAQRVSIRRAFATDDGKVALKFLHDLCGWAIPGTVADPQTGEVFPTSRDHNEAQRGVYMNLRKFISPQVLAITEIPGWGIDEEIEDLLS